MRIGYSFWGFLGDVKFNSSGDTVSTPDGNATYSWALIWELQRRGHDVHAMQEDRDFWGVNFIPNNFEAFSEQKRISAYTNLWETNGVGLPELDVLILEWRWAIPGRNTCDDKNKPFYQPDLERQTQLLQHYSGTKTKVVIWDLDHKLTENDETHWDPDAILETSVKPLELFKRRRRVEPPCIIDDLLQFETIKADPHMKLSYVGSRYERDDVITHFIKPISDAYPGHVHFFGNWLNSLDECHVLWPNVTYNGRITTRDFRKAYASAVACPLLAKRSYLHSGFITPRPWEAILFGTIPVGLAEMRGIQQYVTHSARSGEDMIDLIYELSQLSLKERDLLRQESAHKLRFMDARHFVDVVEEIANGLDHVVPEEHNE